MESGPDEPTAGAQAAVISGWEKAGRSAVRRRSRRLYIYRVHPRARERQTSVSDLAQVGFLVPSSHEAGMYFTSSGLGRFSYRISGVSRASLSRLMSFAHYSAGTNALI